MHTPICVFRSSCALLIASAIFVFLLPQEGDGKRLKYQCPEAYRRIGNGCYYLSSERLTWHEAQYACRDLAGGYLAKLNKRWKDRNIQRFLNRSEGERPERWIGTIYDFQRKFWIWGVGGERLRYQGFTRRRPNDNYNWKCGVMNPKLYYRWSTRSCIEKKAFICEIPIKVVSEEDRRRKKMMRTKTARDKKRRADKKKQYRPDIETNRIT